MSLELYCPTTKGFAEKPFFTNIQELKMKYLEYMHDGAIPIDRLDSLAVAETFTPNNQFE